VVVVVPVVGVVVVVVVVVPVVVVDLVVVVVVPVEVVVAHFQLWPWQPPRGSLT
jgi:hypothetical protein